MCVLEICPYFHIGLLGLSAKLLEDGDIKEAYPHPILRAPANREVACRHMQEGSLPAYGCGLSDILEHPRYWMANGPDPETPELYFIFKEWSDLDSCDPKALITTQWTISRPIHHSKILQMLSSTHKRNQGRNHMTSELRRDMKIGRDIGVLSFDMEKMHAWQAYHWTIPVAALLTEANNSRFARLKLYFLEKFKACTTRGPQTLSQATGASTRHDCIAVGCATNHC